MNLYDITNLDFVTMVTSDITVFHVDIFYCEWDNYWTNAMDIFGTNVIMKVPFQSFWNWPSEYCGKRDSWPPGGEWQLGARTWRKERYINMYIFKKKCCCVARKSVWNAILSCGCQTVFYAAVPHRLHISRPITYVDCSQLTFISRIDNIPEQIPTVEPTREVIITWPYWSFIFASSRTAVGFVSGLPAYFSFPPSTYNPSWVARQPWRAKVERWAAPCAGFRRASRVRSRTWTARASWRRSPPGTTRGSMSTGWWTCHLLPPL